MKKGIIVSSINVERRSKGFKIREIDVVRMELIKKRKATSTKVGKSCSNKRS